MDDETDLEWADFQEPEDGDYTTGDHERWYQYGKLAVTGDYADVVQHMNQEKFWPNAWFISDHGNAHLITMESDDE